MARKIGLVVGCCLPCEVNGHTPLYNSSVLPYILLLLLMLLNRVKQHNYTSTIKEEASKKERGGEG